MQKFKRQLTAPLPEGWFAKESITLLAPNGQANVIASSEPLDPAIDTNLYAQVQGDLLRKEFPRYREFASEPARMLAGKNGYMRHFEWTPAGGDAVTQIQFYYAEEGRGYTITATAPSTQFERFEVQFRQLLVGFALDLHAQPELPTKPHVLVVEDDENLRELLMSVVRLQDYTVDGAINGRDGINQLRARRPSLIVLDLMMPVMDGWQFRQAQLQDPTIADVPVLCLSAVPDLKTIGQRMGVQCMSKPIDLDYLAATIRHLCERHEHR